MAKTDSSVLSNNEIGFGKTSLSDYTNSGFWGNSKGAMIGGPYNYS
jgi:hypothetical protein